MPKPTPEWLLSEARAFIKQGYGTVGMAWVAEAADALESEIARANRYAAIFAEAPHAISCAYTMHGEECTCWKSKLHTGGAS